MIGNSNANLIIGGESNSHYVESTTEIFGVATCVAELNDGV